MAFDAHKNFAYSLVATAPSPATSGTSLIVTTGDGTKFPTPPFNATIWPTNTQPTTSNAEIVRVTAIGTDTLTIVRAQESSSARTVVIGDQISASVTVKIATDIEAAVNPTGMINAYAGRTAPTNWLACDGTAQSRATFASLFGVIAPSLGTMTVTIAAPAVVTLSGHGFITGDQVYFTTTGALPTGLVANTIYFVVAINSTTFNLATTLANAIAATKITTTGTQSGTHTAVACPWGLGDGSTTFNVPDLRGRVPAGADTMFGGTAASRLTGSTTTGTYGTLGAAGGEQAHALIIAELAAHTHETTFTQTVGGIAAGGGIGQNRGTTGFGDASLSTGSGTAHNVVQPTVIVNYIIKT